MLANDPSAFQTYRILAPAGRGRDYWYAVTCEQARCEAYQYGWQTFVDESTDLGRRQAHYIRSDRSRSFREERNAAGITVFTFGAGQKCFESHQARTGRPDRYVVARGRPGSLAGVLREHTRAQDWIEDFQESLDEVRDQVERG